MAQAGKSARLKAAALTAVAATLFKEIPMQANGTVPQPSPGTYVPIEIPSPIVPPEPGGYPEIEDPTPTEPIIPVREPGTHSPAQAM